MVFLSKSEKETQKAAEALAKELIVKRSQKQKRGATVVGLEGELGAGKTVFAKGFARGLGIKAKITSPTFVLMKSYHIRSPVYKTLFHFDCYRLKDHEDMLKLGAKEIFGENENIVIVEWCDRVKKALPENYLKVHIDHFDRKTRKINIKK